MRFKVIDGGNIEIEDRTKASSKASEPDFISKGGVRNDAAFFLGRSWPFLLKSCDYVDLSGTFV
jgi:hypothetical protein